MSFIRPEVRALGWRFRDALWGGAVAVLGLYWVLQSFGLLQWLGYVVVIFGAIWTIAGVQRAFFRQGSDGPGVVQIREGRLAYMGPLDGGVMDIADLMQLAIDPTSKPAPSWILTGRDSQRVCIPINAAGAEDLFDVFAGLPQIKTNKVLDVLAHKPDTCMILWQRVKPLLH